MIERRLIEEMFENTTRAGWDMRLEMVWGYWFLSRDRGILRQVSQWLANHHYRYVRLMQDDQCQYWLQVERFEKHTVESLCHRNIELSELGKKHGVTYDGPDVAQPAVSRDWLCTIPIEHINLSPKGWEDMPLRRLEPSPGVELLTARPIVDDVPVQCPLTPAHDRWRGKFGPVSLMTNEFGTTDFQWIRARPVATHPRAAAPETDSIRSCLVSKGAQEAFVEAGLVGYDLQPVFAACDGSEVIGLRRLVVTGWAGLAKPESGVQFLSSQSCRACGMAVYSWPVFPELMFNWEQMEYADFVRLWPIPEIIFMSRRAAGVIQAAGLSGAEALSVQSIALSLADRVMPDSPSQWFPESMLRPVFNEVRFGPGQWPVPPVPDMSRGNPPRGSHKGLVPWRNGLAGD